MLYKYSYYVNLQLNSQLQTHVLYEFKYAFARFGQFKVVKTKISLNYNKENSM
jgi:hypothetical protein